MWVLGLVAVVAASFAIYNAFFGGPPALQKIAETARVCPPLLSVPPRSAGAPADDVVGLRPGFSLKDAQETLLCRDEHYHFEFEPIWHTAVPSSVESRQRMHADKPPERLTLGLVGQPQQEIAYAIFQDIQYRESEVTATPQATIDALKAHYGAPHARTNTGTRIDLWWLYLPDGKPVIPVNTAQTDLVTQFTNWASGSWNFGGCQKHVGLDPLAQANWSPQCGLSIHAEIDVRKEDASRMQRYRIVVMDQARLGAAVENYRERAGIKVP